LSISSNENMRQGLQYSGALRSAFSGAVQRQGEGPIGFRTPEQLRAQAGGNVTIDNARTTEQAYSRDADKVTTTQEEIIRMRKEATKGAGTAIGVQGAGVAAAPTIFGGVGKGLGGGVTISGGGQLPTDTAARSRATGSGGFSSGGNTSTSSASGPNVINMSFNFTGVTDAMAKISNALSSVWNRGKLGD
jgi:hypothetical protein